MSLPGAGVLLWALLTLVLASWSGHGAAVELQPDQTYAGGTQVESPQVGVSFLIPEGWVGRFGQDARHRTLVLGSQAIEGVGLVILQSETTAAQLIASLNAPQDLGAGVILRPIAPPVAQGSRIVVRYRSPAYVGQALALLGPARNAVVFFFAGPPKHDGVYTHLLAGLGASTGFQALGPAPAPSLAPAATGLAQPWSDILPNHALHYFSSYSSGGGGGGMATHRILHLCADGRFLYAGDSLVTMNVPGASGSSGGRAGSHGRWSVESASPAVAVLVLTGDAGGQLRWQLRYDGSKTFMNGQRWLREPSTACR